MPARLLETVVSPNGERGALVAGPLDTVGPEAEQFHVYHVEDARGNSRPRSWKCSETWWRGWSGRFRNRRSRSTVGWQWRSGHAFQLGGTAPRALPKTSKRYFASLMKAFPEQAPMLHQLIAETEGSRPQLAHEFSKTRNYETIFRDGGGYRLRRRSWARAVSPCSV